MDQRKTISLDRDQFLVRAFHWGWGTYPTDTCKLAWGVLFLWIAAFFNLLDFTIGNLFRWLRSRLPEPEQVAYTERLRIREEREAKQERRLARLERVLSSMEWLANIYRYVLSWDYWYVVGWVLIGTIALAAVGGFYLLTTLPNFWGNLLVAVIYIAIATTLAFLSLLTVMGMLRLDEKRDGAISRGFRRSGDIFRSAYHSFHNRTCAKVDVGESPDDYYGLDVKSRPLGGVDG